jgi:hypothetical protein
MTSEELRQLYCVGGPSLAQANKQQRQAVGQQVAGQLEPLLYLAYRLNLCPLQEVLHGFTRNSTVGATAVLFGHMRHVLTRRVLLAAVDCDVAEQAMLQLLVGQRGSLAGAEDGLFRCEGPEAFQTDAIKFTGKLAMPLPSLVMGGQVDVEMDLSKSRIFTDGLTHMFQLLLGPPVDTPSRCKAVLGEGEEAAPATTA